MSRDDSDNGKSLTEAIERFQGDIQTAREAALRATAPNYGGHPGDSGVTWIRNEGKIEAEKMGYTPNENGYFSTSEYLLIGKRLYERLKREGAGEDKGRQIAYQKLAYCLKPDSEWNKGDLRDCVRNAMK